MKIRELVDRVKRFRQECHEEAERMNVDTGRFQILKPPGEAEGFESCDELRFPTNKDER